MWVIQEVALSKSATVFWGSIVFSFDALLGEIQFLGDSISLQSCRSIQTIKKGLTNKFGQFMTVSEKYMLSVGLETTFHYARHYECANPKDKVFGLQGILTRKGWKAPPIDYRTPAAEIFQKTAMSILNQTGRLTLLIQVDGLRSTLDHLPSWVPDWSNRTFALGRIPDLSNNQATEEKRPTFKFTQSGKCLQAQVVFVDKLAYRSC